MTDKYFIIMESTKEPMFWGDKVVYFDTYTAAEAFLKSVSHYSVCSMSLTIIVCEGKIITGDEEWQDRINNWEDDFDFIDFTDAVFYYDYETDSEFVTIENKKENENV
jgi:hypothetical protein